MSTFVEENIGIELEAATRVGEGARFPLGGDPARSGLARAVDDIKEIPMLLKRSKRANCSKHRENDPRSER